MRESDDHDRLDEIREHLTRPYTSPLFLLDACHWLVDFVERLRAGQEVDKTDV